MGLVWPSTVICSPLLSELRGASQSSIFPKLPRTNPDLAVINLFSDFLWVFSFCRGRRFASPQQKESGVQGTMAPMTGKVIKDWTAEMPSGVKLDGKSVLVVGGTSGLGQAIARECQAKGASPVTVVGRSFKDDASKIKFVQADLSLMSEAKKVGETVEPADVVVLTTGIIAAATRQASGEGIEMYMAVSFLSRLVILKYLTPRLKPGSRVFVMGFPGSNTPVKNLEDFNWEKSYDGGFGAVHTNTVSGNEALVLEYASKSNGILYFGLNPGLIKTGIRSNMYTGGAMKYFFGPLIEGMLGIFSSSPRQYASRIVPLFVSSSLDAHNGAMFNPKALPIEPSEYLTKDDMVAKIMKASRDVVRAKAGIDV
jgi:NAD(P)-dependent dehydrogenase (short-subunit alcohol dehydrogenase family)